MLALVTTTLLLAALPSGEPARAFPIDGPFEWGGPETGFGDRGGAHDGEDVFADCGTPLVAAAPGRVAISDEDGGAGIHLVIRRPGNAGDHVYMHLQSAPRVDVGDRVEAGERIGRVGRSGNASACHLHFETWTAPGWFAGGEARDPRPALERWARASSR